MPAPQLSLSTQALRAQSELEDVQGRASILSELIAGKSMLALAQEYGLSEKQVQGYLNEALETQTEFMKKNADTLQQMFFLQHQEMYEKAREAAFLTDEKTGKTKARDVFWFREMRASLQAMENILAKYMKKANDTPITFHVTVQPNTPLADLALRVKEDNDGDAPTIVGS